MPHADVATWQSQEILWKSCIHLGCMSHASLTCCTSATQVRAHFTRVNSFIATVKATTVRNKDQRENFNGAGLLTLPQSVLTMGDMIERYIFLLWASSCYVDCRQQLGRQQTTRDTCQGGRQWWTFGGWLGQYRPLADDVKHFEASHFTILQANRELVRLKNCSLATIHAIFATIWIVDWHTLILRRLLTFYVPQFHLHLLKAQPSFAAVERSFSTCILKKILRRDKPFKSFCNLEIERKS